MEDGPLMQTRCQSYQAIGEETDTSEPASSMVPEPPSPDLRDRTVIDMSDSQDGSTTSFRVGTCCQKIKNMIDNNQFLKSTVGIMLVVLAGFGFTIANVFQNSYLRGVNFFHMLFFRAVIQMIFCVLKMAHTGVGFFGGLEERRLRVRIVFQGLLGGFLLLCIFSAVSKVPLGNASSIFFCTPVFTFLFATCMLGEFMGPFRCFLSALMLGGVCLITRPSVIFGDDDTSGKANSNDTSLFGYGSILAYTVCFLVPMMSAIVSILTRQLRQVVPAVLMFWFAVGALFISLVGCAVVGNFDLISYTKTQWLSLMFVVIIGILGNLSYTVAMHCVSPSKANVFRSFEVILNFFLQIQLQGFPFHSEAIGGIVCLLLAVVGIALEDKIANWTTRNTNSYSRLP